MLLISGCSSLLGQCIVSIDSVVLDGVVEAKERDMYISRSGEGPVISMHISITNNHPDPLIIVNHDYELYCEYTHNGSLHKSLPLYLTINNEDHVYSIPPYGTYTESLSTPLFLSFEAIELDDVIIYDYTTNLREVLSSLRLVFNYYGKRYVSKNKPIIKKGDLFFLEWRVENY